MTNNSQSNSAAKKIVKNFGFLSFGRVFGDLFTFLLFITLTRTYGQEGIGDYSFAMAYVGFFAVFADFGLYHLSVKEMSRNKTPDLVYFNTIFTNRLILTLLVFAALLGCALILNYPKQLVLIILTLGIYQLVWHFVDGLNTLFISAQEMLIPSLLEIGLKFVTAVLGILLCLTNTSLNITLLAFPTAAVLGLLISFYFVSSRFEPPRITVNFKNFLTTLSEAKPYCASEFLRQLSTRVDVILIGILISIAAAGIYNVGYRVIVLLLFVTYFGSLAIFPHASSEFKHAKNNFKNLYNQSLNSSILIAVPASAGLWLLSPDLILLFFGQEFEQSIIILQYLSWLILLVSLSSIMGVFLTSSDQQHTRTRCQWAAAFTNVIGNLILIPTVGIKGAALATILSEFLLVALYGYKLMSVVGLPNIFNRLLIGAAGSSIFIIFHISNANNNIFITAAVSIFIYIAFISIFKDIRQKELNFLLDYLKRK